MKRGKYKQKIVSPVGFESETAFDFASIYAADEKIDIDAASHGATRDEVEAWLKRRGLTQDQRVVVLKKFFDHKTTREIAKACGKSHTWVVKILKRTTARESLRHLQRGELLPTTTDEMGLSQAVQNLRNAFEEARNSFLLANPTDMVIEIPATCLTDAMREARKVLTNTPQGGPVDAGYLGSQLDDMGVSAKSSRDEWAIATIAVRPDLLLQPKWRPLLEKFVELLTAARYGNKEVAASARKILMVLTRAKRGNRCPMPDNLLVSKSLPIYIALNHLRQNWQGFIHDPIPTRLEGIRELIGPQHSKFSNTELQSLMNAELLTATARVAEKATDIAAESFLRAWKKYPPDRSPA